MKIFRNITRILVGLVFIFSGFVKGVDPLGTVYRMEDYFAAFHTSWANPLALSLTIFLCTLEFSLGISLLFNLWIRKTAWLLLPLMIYFTILTFFDATVNLVADCGCFGDAIKLTNLQTFLKNVVLLIFVIIIFSGRKKFKSALPVSVETFILALFFIAFSWMSVYSYRHLPLIDFMSWRIGNKVNETSKKPMKFYLVFKNKKSGKEQEFLSPNYPWNDSVWMSEWEFKKQRVDDLNANQTIPLKIEDEKGSDVTSDFIDNPDFQFLFVAFDLSETNKKAFNKILPFYKKVLHDGYSFICLTAASPSEIKRFRLSNGTAFNFYNSTDDVILKVMIRSNPGLILIKSGKVLAKWHYNDFPNYEDVKKQFLVKK